MKILIAAFAMLISSAPGRGDTPVELHTGEKFVKARTGLLAQGWRADPRAHASSGEYSGVDRQLIQAGFDEVDFCSMGKSLCVLQYVRGDACLRLHTQGEQIRAMKVVSWSSACREPEPGEDAQMLPADIRFLAQWHGDCENFGQCDGMGNYLIKLKKKYAHNPSAMKELRRYEVD